MPAPFQERVPSTAPGAVPAVFPIAGARWAYAVSFVSGALLLIAGVVNGFAGRNLYWLIGFGGLASASTALRGLVTRYEVSADAVRIRTLGGTRTIAAFHIAHVLPTALIDAGEGSVRWPCTRVALRSASGERLAIVYPADVEGFTRAVEGIIRRTTAA